MEKNLKIFTDNIEEEAVNQINLLLEQEPFKDCKVRIMPDVHAGKVMGRFRSFYAVYNIKDNEQCVMVDTLDRIAKYVGIQEQSIRKAMYMHKNIRKKYLVEKV